MPRDSNLVFFALRKSEREPPSDRMGWKVSLVAVVCAIVGACAIAYMYLAP